MLHMLKKWPRRGWCEILYLVLKKISSANATNNEQVYRDPDVSCLRAYIPLVDKGSRRKKIGKFPTSDVFVTVCSP